MLTAAEAKPAYADNDHQTGLNTLEAFTMAALQGILANQSAPDYHTQNHAERAVRAARATIAELERVKAEE